MHELGHLLGLSHPDQTGDYSDDFTDNWMAGAHFYQRPLGSTGTFPSVSQRQCILLSLDLNHYIR